MGEFCRPISLSAGRCGRRLGLLSTVALGTVLAAGQSAHALTINPTFDAGVSAQAQAAFNFAAGEYQNLFSDPVTVNIRVSTMSTGLGMSNTPLQFVPGGYSGTRSALIADYALNPSADRTTATGAGGSINTTTDPTTGGHFYMAFAEAKAVGLRAANNTASDGTFSYNSTLTYTFDPNNRGSGGFDFIGVAEHEISEIMGRISLLGQNLDGSPDFLPYELFRYTGNNARGITNNGADNYFSINNGATNLKNYNNAALNGGDAQDWDSSVLTDPYNASTGPNQAHMISAVDIRAMDVLGWDTQAVVPAPMIGFGFPAFLATGGLLFGAKLLGRARRAARLFGFV